MVEEKRFENGQVRIRYHALSRHEIAQMTPARMAEYLEYIERQLALWAQPTHGKPAWFANAASQWRNALNSEKRRINGALRARREMASEEAEYGNA